MNTIRFEGHAEVANIKVRTEGSKVENTQRPAIDLTMTMQVSADILPALLGCTQAEAADFWNKEPGADKHYQRYPNLKTMRSGAVFENCKVSFDSVEFRAAKLSAMSFTLQADQVLDLHFRVSLAGLSDKSSGYLCAQFHEKINFLLESSQTDLVDEIEGADNAN